MAVPERTPAAARPGAAGMSSPARQKCPSRLDKKVQGGRTQGARRLIDEGLLGTARAAGAKLEAAERGVVLARAEYHTAIRRLHLAGAPLREIASALRLSHQRVQQIVRNAG